jgi:hypothetical protein
MLSDTLSDECFPSFLSRSGWPLGLSWVLTAPPVAMAKYGAPAVSLALKFIADSTSTIWRRFDYETPEAASNEPAGLLAATHVHS